ncbi:hypothetical protein GP486_001524 [Trichoglossum hirsutum]|uniref:Prion-inhibition and propagation HeLo domain-containing protein n=1 Tax=Trichoglossum hirsutum TaxID=265104 RepID=A0A9P8LH00_9PEZI|nr:hypothetical protein GP486_001524 [Trichoglossum hirsutum]
MSGFEPIAGTIAFVALIDPGLRGFSWIYGKYKLGKSFGRDYHSLEILYRSEIVRFIQIRDQKIDLLGDSPLNDPKTRLKNAVHERLVLELEALEECEELVRKHDARHLEAEEREANKDDGSASDNQKGTLPLTVSSSASRASTNANRLTDSTVVSSTSSATTVAPSTTTTSRSRSGRSHFSTWKKRFSFHQSKKSGSTLTHISSPILATSIAEQEAQKELQRGRENIHAKSTFTERAMWAIGERERFIELVNKLKEHNDYFVSLLQIQLAIKRNESINESEPSPLLDPARRIAYRLRRLIQAIAAGEYQDHQQFQIMLYDDPFQLRSRLAKGSPISIGLRPSSSVFAFQLLNPSLENTESPAPQTMDNISVFFEVPSLDHPSQTADMPPRASDSITLSFDKLWDTLKVLEGRHPQPRSFCHAIGTLKEVGVASHGPIALLLDRTPYRLSKTLTQTLKDPAGSNMLRKKYLIFRARLAYVLAATFLQFLLAGQPLDYTSDSLYYYARPATTALSSDEMVSMLVAPYIQLENIGAATFPVSSTSVLTSAAETVTNDQIMVQRLGVVLYEVGTWKAITEPHQDWRARSSAARFGKLELVRCWPTVDYFNAVHACLEWMAGDLWNVEEQAIQLAAKVVTPLKRQLSTLPPEFQTG